MTYAVTISGNNISLSMAAVEYSVSLSQSGLQGTPGKGIVSSAYNDATGILTITYTDATTETLDLSGIVASEAAAAAAAAAASASQVAADASATAAAASALSAAENAMPNGGEILFPIADAIPTGWYDTGSRLLSGVSERAILSNDVRWNYAANWKRPSLVLDATSDRYILDGSVSTFPDTVTHTRASTATYVDSTGTLQTAAINEPRIGHHVWNGSAWVNEGLLHESEARTNLLTYSEDLSNAAWTKSGGVTIGTPVTRKGISLDLIQSDGVTNFDTVYQSFGSVANGEYATFSLFIEAGSSVETAIRIDDVGAGLSFNRCTVPITWTLGVPSLQADVTLGLTFVDANLQDYGDGLYRVHLTVLNNTGGSLTLYGAYYVVWDEPAAAVNTYAGGFQAEIAPTPSSYIPTSGSTVTRAADVLTIPAANLPWNPLAVSIQMEGRVTYADTGIYEEFIFNEWYRDSNNEISFRVDTFGAVTGKLTARYRVSGSDIYPGIANEFSPDVGIPYNVAYRATSTSVQLASGGTTSGVTSVTGLPDIENGTLYLGHSRYMGTIRTFRIWADDIGDAGLVEATT